MKSRAGLNYYRTGGVGKYGEVFRGGHDCSSIDNNMDLVQHKRRNYYEYRRNNARVRRNEEIGVYASGRSAIPEFECDYETQHTASSQSQQDANDHDNGGGAYFGRRYYYGKSSFGGGVVMASSSNGEPTYGGGMIHSYEDYHHKNGHQNYEYNVHFKKPRGGGTVTEYYNNRSCDSRGSSVAALYQNNYPNNKKVKYSDDYVDENPHGNEISSRDNYRNNNTTISTHSEEIDHFQWYVGQHLTWRYRILDMIGEGTFGRVFECEDLKRKRKVAIKVIRNVQRYTSAAKIEAEILRDINMEDEFGEYSYCVMLYNAFLYNNSNMCLVFERLGPSLYDFLDGNCSRGFFLADIQNIAEQFLLGLSFLRRMKLTHTDLKLENILLTDNNYIWVNAPRHPGTLVRRPVRPEIRLIDFGAATYEHDYHGSVINTRQYRAPEVILDLGWDMSSDMWGFGCILMELYTGVLLFKTHEHMEHLAMVEKIIEPFPDHMLKRAYTSGKSGRKYVDKVKIHDVEGSVNNSEYYHQYGTMEEEYGGVIMAGGEETGSFAQREDYRYVLNWPEGSSSSNSIKRVNDCKSLESLVHRKHLMLAKFVRYILRPDPSLRPTPEMALRHEFFRYKFEEEI